ncbi:glutamate--tRNA ligase [Deferribacterales bacterium Es71-Z0220]|nr:glutamate--tRNA ligase [Deferrivibrio essentukiensis]MCB4203988.1 glutamate--tRNA ligase [Deferrivibrio essentukiensis]
MSIVRVRFAPSPTGHIHVGNVRTALFNYLFSKNRKGVFVLRIEDTDLERSSIENENIIYEDLNWLGLNWDEGPNKGGDYAPYKQTERVDIYKKYIDDLLEKGFAYYCFCSKEELEQEREKNLKEGKNPIYSGKCRNISLEEARQRIAGGEKAAVRFKVDESEVKVKDILKGEIDFPTSMFGDFIIVRPDGVPVYNFVVVVDDALMNITHVIRGDDHLNNTPKQILIYKALGFSIPEFAHIPMILGPDHSKLSKRHGDTSVNQFRENGYLPDAFFNYLALLGWSHPEEKEILTKEELIDAFSLNRISKSAAVFDFDKLKWMNGVYIREKSRDELFELAKPFVTVADTNSVDEEWLKDVVYSVKDKITTLREVDEQIKIFFEQSSPDDESMELLNLETSPLVLQSYLNEIEGISNLTADKYKEVTKKIQKDTGAKGKALFMVLRIGLTGQRTGPDMDKIATLLPVSEQVKRIRYILGLIKR